MSLSPVSGGGAPLNTSGTGEVLSAVMAKNQQQKEGAQAMQLLQSAGQVAAPKPVGNAGHNINVMV